MRGCFNIALAIGTWFLYGCDKTETWPKGYNRKEWLELPTSFQTSGYLSLDDSGKDLKLPRVMKTYADLKKYNVVNRFRSVDMEQHDIITISMTQYSYRKIESIQPRYFINLERKQFHLSEGVDTRKSDRYTTNETNRIHAFVPNIPDGFTWVDGE